jgi:hypothetical protein
MADKPSDGSESRLKCSFRAILLRLVFSGGEPFHD